MAIAYQTSTTGSSINLSTLVMNTPSGTVDGDLLIAFVSHISASGNIMSTLSGWTQITNATGNGGGATPYLNAWYKIASSEGSSYTWSTTGSVTILEGCTLRINGQKSSGFIDASFGSVSAGTGTSLSFANGVTPTYSDNLLLQAWATYNLSGANQNITSEAIATSNPTWAEACDITGINGATAVSLTVAYANRTPTTATGGSSATASQAATQGSCGIIISINREVAFVSTISDTTTLSESMTPQIGYKITTTDTITPTDTNTTTNGRPWSNPSKTATTWNNQSK